MNEKSAISFHSKLHRLERLINLSTIHYTLASDSYHLSTSWSMLIIFNNLIRYLFILTFFLAPSIASPMMIQRATKVATSGTTSVRRVRSFLIRRTNRNNFRHNFRRYAHTFIALGSNIEPRFDALQSGCELISKLPNTTLLDTSYLYETKPMYVTDQNSFLNAVVKIDTTLKPHDLLSSLKDIEKNVGRTPSIRNGPRQLDLDILLYLSGSSSLKLNETNPDPSSPLPLEIPHPRIEEREFVLRPLADLFPSYALPLLKELNSDEAVRVIPLGGNRTLKMDRTRVMGILNVTPDSFSDGGEYDDVGEKGKNPTHTGTQ